MGPIRVSKAATRCLGGMSAVSAAKRSNSLVRSTIRSPSAAGEGAGERSRAAPTNEDKNLKRKQPYYLSNTV